MAKHPPRSRKEKRKRQELSDEEIPAAAASGDKGYHPGGRNWSDEYAVAVLRGVIEFRSRTGGAPTASTTGAFFDSIKDSLPLTVTQDQLYRKVRHLRKKYDKAAKDCDAGEDVPYHELLREAWGNDEKKTKVDNFRSTEVKKAKVEQSAFSTQKAKKTKVQASGIDGKLEGKEVQRKGKDKIGKKRPSGTTSKKSKVKKLSPVATRERVSGRSHLWQDDYSDEGFWPEASDRRQSNFAEELRDWFA